MNKVDICNNALDLVGNGLHISSLDEQSKEADLLRRNYQNTVEQALTMFHFSFSRKDEVITEEHLVNDYISLPWKYSYSIPDDVLTILYLSRYVGDTGDIMDTSIIHYNFRNIKNKKCIVTNEKAPFIMQYICKVEDESLFSASFIDAIQYLLASKLATGLIHGTSGIQIADNLMQKGLSMLAFSAGQDAQQGSEDLLNNHTPLFIRARG